MSRPYHYTECGLDYVYLIGGYSIIHTEKDGDCVTIVNPEALNKAIGKFLITRRKVLSGTELRFLRHEMDMSQPTLAHLLRVTEQTVQKWEAGKRAQVPAPADALIRLLYSECMGERAGIRRRLKRIADLEDQIDDLVTFTHSQSATGHTWRETRPVKAA
jgi:DNA-binding transcriptional regulator YiaG